MVVLLIGFGAGTGNHEQDIYYPAGAEESFTSTMRLALDHGGPGSTFAYADTDQRGTITVVGSISTAFGPCLQFRHDWTSRGGRETASGLACRSDDGDWSVLTLPPKPRP